MKQLIILLLTCAAMEGKGQDTAHMNIDSLYVKGDTLYRNGKAIINIHSKRLDYKELDRMERMISKGQPYGMVSARTDTVAIPPPTTKYDTAKVVMDIAYLDSTGKTASFITTESGQKLFFNFTMRGYEVFIEVFKPYDPDDRHVLPGAQLSVNNKGERYWIVPRQHFEYLDENRKPLSKSIIVWQVK